VLTDDPVRDTVEIRILPGSVDPDEIVHRAALIELLLDRCLDPDPIRPPANPASGVETLLEMAAQSLNR
jgi:hypothetical protein